MLSGSVVKNSLLCYPFEDYAAAFHSENPSYRGRRIVPPGTMALVPPQNAQLPSAIFCSQGKCRLGRGIFCVFPTFASDRDRKAVCRSATGLAAKRDSFTDTGRDGDRDLSLIRWTPFG